MQILDVTTIKKPLAKPNPMIDTSTMGSVTMKLADPVTSGESYLFLVKTKVVGPAMSLVTNNSTIYAGGKKLDTIESGFDPKQFSDNEDPETITIKQCKIDGVVYLDVNMNKEYNTGDIVQANQDITITNGFVTKTMKTNGSGYYMFDELSCRHNWTSSFVNTTPYLPDSAQYQQAAQSSSSTAILITTGSREDGYKTRLYSENNNFGLALYDLWIKKSLDDAYRTEGTTGTYTITFGNNGPVTARDVVVTDWYDAAVILPIQNTLQLNGLPTTTKITWSGNSLVLSNLPEMTSGSSYAMTFQATFSGKDTRGWNYSKIYVGTDKTDRYENKIFENKLTQ